MGGEGWPSRRPKVSYEFYQKALMTEALACNTQGPPTHSHTCLP